MNYLKLMLVTLLTISCFTLVKAQTDVTTVRIDPETALGGKVGDFFDEVEFIPLETTKESTFGRISQMKVIDDFYVIGDNETGSILIFSTNGKFVNKIKMQMDFSLDRENKQILVLGINNEILYYTLDGKYLRSLSVKGNFEKLFSLANGVLAFNVPRPLQAEKVGKTAYDVVYRDSKTDSVLSLFPYNTKYGIYDYNMYANLFNDQGDGSCIFSFPYRYSAYELDSKGIAKAYHFVFPEKFSLPKDFGVDSLYHDKRKDYIFNPKTAEDYYKFKGLNPFFKHGDILLFNTNHSYLTYNNDLLYDLGTKTTYSLNRLTGDSLSCYLPILHSQSMQALAAIDQYSLYTSVPAVMFLKLRDQSVATEKPGKHLVDISQSIKPTDNPVIIRSRFKN